MAMTVSHLRCEHRRGYLGLDTPTPRFSWWIDDPRPGALQTAYQIQVAAVSLGSAVEGGGVAGAADAFTRDAVLWDSGECDGSESVLIQYAGEPLQSCTRYVYRVRACDHEGAWSEWSEPDWFETAFLDQGEWKANWIVSDDDEGPLNASPYMRTTFEVSGEIVSARLYIAARGLVEPAVNGRTLGDQVLSPGWTDYNKRCQYVTYDVGRLLRTGKNALGAVLGGGWYVGRIATVHDGVIAHAKKKQPRYGVRPQLLCQLHICTADGPEHVVTSGDSWEWRTGPILAADIYDGETYDARLELTRWREPDGRTDGWAPVRVVGPASARWDGTLPDDVASFDNLTRAENTAISAASAGPDPRPREGAAVPRLDAKLVPPVRRVREITPIERSEPEPGRFVFDLGQNIAGWARVALDAPAGTVITVRFAEMLNPDGTMYVENLRSAEATDTYIAAGGSFVWEPKFTFHGFRYIELSLSSAGDATALSDGRADSSAPPLSAVTGIVLHNDLEETGTFECSHSLVNQLQSNIQWGQRGNYLEAPTDCPQRDERLGWTGDAQVFIPTAGFNMNVAPFFTKWQRDLADAQGPGGTIPAIAPAVRWMDLSTLNDGGPAWSDAFIICPWTVWQRFGDVRSIEEQYDAMRDYVESLRKRSTGLIRSDEFFVNWGGFGDWVSMDAPEGSRVGATPKDLIGTAYFAYVAGLISKMAERLGRRRDVQYFRELRRRIVSAFQNEFVTQGGRVLGDTQTSYAVALAFDVLPEDLRQAAVDRLVRLLEKRGWRLSTGFVGAPLLCPVLTRYGRADVAYKLLLQEEFPSWLYTVKQGATTMWERWNSYTHEHGFGPVEMNSFNHYAYGAIGDWMYSTVAGLSVDLTDPNEPPIRIAPRPGYGIEWARAELETPFGVASTRWTIENGEVELTAMIPANASARISLPAPSDTVAVQSPGELDPQPRPRGNGAAVPEAAAPSHVGIAPSGRADANRDADACYRIGAGTYTFRWAQ
jgi:alpha-L-rhamnosidase